MRVRVCGGGQVLEVSVESGAEPAARSPASGPLPRWCRHRGGKPRLDSTRCVTQRVEGSSSVATLLVAGRAPSPSLDRLPGLQRLEFQRQW